MHTVVFLSELKNIDTCTGDISKSYLTASTNENIVFNAGPYFSPIGHSGHLILINTTLYVPKSYGSSFHSQLSYDLIDLGFVPSVGGCDSWMHNKVYKYSYVACY